MCTGASGNAIPCRDCIPFSLSLSLSHTHTHTHTHTHSQTLTHTRNVVGASSASSPLQRACPGIQSHLTLQSRIGRDNCPVWDGRTHHLHQKRYKESGLYVAVECPRQFHIETLTIYRLNSRRFTTHNNLYWEY